MAAVHTVYALIANREVQNIVVGDFENCNKVARETYGENAIAVEVTQIPVYIGDSYDGAFWRREGAEMVRIKPIPTVEQQLEQLVMANERMQNELDTVSLVLLADVVPKIEEG